MPRRNQPKRPRGRHFPNELKGKNKKRPRSFHRSGEVDLRFMEAERRFRAAEEEAA